VAFDQLFYKGLYAAPRQPGCLADCAPRGVDRSLCDSAKSCSVTPHIFESASTIEKNCGKGPLVEARTRFMRVALDITLDDPEIGGLTRRNVG
jgi:hypothetical protein